MSPVAPTSGLLVVIIEGAQRRLPSLIRGLSPLKQKLNLVMARTGTDVREEGEEEIDVRLLRLPICGVCCMLVIIFGHEFVNRALLARCSVKTKAPFQSVWHPSQSLSHSQSPTGGPTLKLNAGASPGLVRSANPVSQSVQTAEE